ncbi:ribosome biogenesis GTP-binding protein YihA/YsxC [Mycoplasma sp. 'Moose RK']|uniref:ribosome biogenesis GTP-binding protein YihA/YsxC n=1 Tax=Mycoplasma sp. 'Moose RK' TaxID=2780095 RepID=UPI0018C316CA|nr:ribosome biogenesis GTP-binding protein YihA/YsxC [Mycoplasma sp. 'Moose RK']MBG0730730.1 YihA family ribosome biogenesis GTP-binding protein [Mycoplasma sp. 'Moose RK']
MWKFLRSCPENCFFEPQLVFIGRSNVGKSSLINALAGAKIARVSGKPGHTQLLNFYRTTQQKLIVDLPGYGYARLSKEKKQQIEVMIYDFFTKNQYIVLVFLLIDAKVGFSQLDLKMIEFLKLQNLKIQILANKIDKTNQSERASLTKECQNLQLDCLQISAKSKNNLTKLNEKLNK